MIFFQNLFSENIWKGSKDGASVSIRCNSDFINIPDELILSLSYKIPEGYFIDKKALRKNLLSYYGYGAAPFSLISEKEILNTITYVLKPQITGFYFLTFGEILFHSKDSPTISLLTNVFPITISLKDYEYVEGDLAPLVDFSRKVPLLLNRENKEKTFNNKENVANEKEKIIHRFALKWNPLFLFIFLLFIKLLFFSSVFYKIYLRNKIFLSTKKLFLNQEEEVLFELSELKKMNLPETGRADQFFEILGNILRKYIEIKWAIKTSALTTYEFLNKFSQEYNYYNEIITFLLLCDEIKFAKRHVSKKICKDALMTIEDFIHKN